MEFFTLLTDIGKSKIAAAQMAGKAVQLTEMAVGDGNGSYHTPTEGQAALVNEVWRGTLNDLSLVPDNAHWLVAELIVPATVGGFSIREAGVFDADGDLIAVGKYPVTYKPNIDSGVANDLYIKMILEIENATAVVLKIDPAVVLASREYVDAKGQSILGQMNNGFLISCPVGIPQPWPTNIPPEGWVIMQGQSFSLTAYPQLAKTYPSGVLPDMRGQTIKGAPGGRNILSTEADGIKSHSHSGFVDSINLSTKTSSTSGAHTHNFIIGNYGSSYINTSMSADSTNPSIGTQRGTVTVSSAGNHDHTVAIGSHSHTLTINANGNSENTVKNIAFNWIVRLA